MGKEPSLASNRIWATMAVVLLVGAAALGVYLTQTGGPIKIGYIGSLTGRYAALSLTGRDGAVLAVEEINKAGGIGGRPVQLVLFDDESDPKKAAQGVAVLQAKKVRAIVGPFTTASTTAAQPVAEKAQIPIVNAVSMGSNLAGKDDFMFRLFTTTAQVGKALGQRILRDRPNPKVCIIWDRQNAPYATSIIDNVKVAMEAAGSGSTHTTSFDSSIAPDRKKLCEECLSENPDAVLLIANSVDTAVLCQWTRRIAPRALVLTTPWGISDETTVLGGKAVDGLIFTLPYDDEARTPADVRFREAYTKRFLSEPTFCSSYHYDAVRVVAEALRSNPSARGDKLRQSLHAIRRFEGLQGEILFDAFGDANPPLLFHRLKNGVIEGDPQ